MAWPDISRILGEHLTKKGFRSSGRKPLIYHYAVADVTIGTSE